MARVNLIEGERLARQGTFVDVAKAAAPAFEAAELGIAERIAEREAETARAEQRTAEYLGKMKSNVDPTKLSDEQQKAVQKFAGEQKQKYLDAAVALGGLKSSDPGYVEQVDIMNSVNRSFENLDANIKGYTEDKIDYHENWKEGQVSKGDTSRYSKASEIYDPSTVFNISENGGMTFGEGENSIDYSDWTPPAPLAHTQATTIFKLANSAHDNSFNSGREVTSGQLEVYRSQLEESIGANPDVIKSLSNDNLLSKYPENLPEYSGKPEDYKEWKDSYIDKIIKGVEASSKQGVDEYNAKNNNQNPSTYRGYSKQALQDRFDSKGNITKGDTVYKYVAMPKGEFSYTDGKYTYKDGKPVSNVVKRELEKIDAIQGTSGAAATFTAENPFKPGYMAINTKDNTYGNNFLTDPMELASIVVTKTNN